MSNQSVEYSLAEVLSKIDNKLDKLDNKIDNLEQKFDNKIDALEQKFDNKFDALEQKFDNKIDALEREESCGGHFREEHQTEEGEAVRNDGEFTYVSAWEFKGEPSDAVLHKEELNYENIELKTRSYK